MDIPVLAHAPDVTRADFMSNATRTVNVPWCALTSAKSLVPENVLLATRTASTFASTANVRESVAKSVLPAWRNASGDASTQSAPNYVTSRATVSHATSPVPRLSGVDTSVSAFARRSVPPYAGCATRIKWKKYSSARRMRKMPGSSSFSTVLTFSRFPALISG